MDPQNGVRRATQADNDRIVQLNADWNGAAAGVEAAAALGHGSIGAPAFAVGVADGHVVSTVGLLSVRFELGAVALPVGQPEFVATDPDFRGRGLVRRQFELVEQWSLARGDVVHMVAGIPYYYRQLGYEYAVERPPWRLVPAHVDLRRPTACVVRLADANDIDEIVAAQDHVQRAADLRLRYAPDLWRLLLTLPHAPVVVATRAGVIEGVARVAAEPGRVYLRDAAATTTDAAHALLAYSRQGAGGATMVPDRRGSAFTGILASSGLIAGQRRWLYIRVPDPAKLLSRLRPVLSARLAESPFASESGTVVLSLYRGRLEITYAQGEVLDVSYQRHVQEHTADIASVPPDQFAPLVLGPAGARGLEEHPDVDLGPHRAFLHVLFPPLVEDVMIW